MVRAADKGWKILSFRLISHKREKKMVSNMYCVGCAHIFRLILRKRGFKI